MDEEVYVMYPYDAQSWIDLIDLEESQIHKEL